MADAPVPARSSKGVFAIALVFALGIVFGAALSVVLLRLQGGFPHPLGGRGGAHPGPGGIGRMMRDLDLDAEQQTRIRAIIEGTQGTIHSTLDEAHREIRAILRPDQQERFDRMRPPGPAFLHGRPRSPRPPGDEPRPPATDR